MKLGVLFLFGIMEFVDVAMNSTSLVGTANVTTVADGLPQVVVITYNVYLSLTMALGIPGNFLLLLVFFRTGTMNSTDWFIVFISIYDFLSSFISVPVYMTFTTGTWRQFGNDVACKIHMVVSQSIVLSSTLLIGGLATERYCKVCRPDVTKLTSQVSKKICISLSLAAISFSLPSGLLFGNQSGFCNTVDDKLLLIIIYYIFTFFIFVTVCIVLVYSYSKIGIAIAKSRKNVKKYRPTTLGISTISSPQSPCIDKLPEATAGKKDSDTNSFAVENLKNYEISQISHESKCFKGTGNSFRIGGSEQGLVTQMPADICSYRNDDTPESIYGLGSSQQDLALNEANAVIGENLSTSDKCRSKTLKIENSIGWHRKRTYTIFLICLIFVVTWLPPWISFFVFIFKSPAMARDPVFLSINMFSRMTYLINTFTNPFLYTIMNTKFREKLKKLLCR